MVTKKFIRKSEGFHVGVVTSGNGSVQSETESITVKKGDKFLIPFKTKEVTYNPLTEMEIVLTFPPGVYP